MASRPVFIPSFDGDSYVRTEKVEFEWFPGMSKAQKQRSIASLHDCARQTLGLGRILETSSKSTEELGVYLSAFNLMISTKKNKRFSVECAFQASKVFEHGGPYADILDMDSRSAKKDSRLKESGRLIGFEFYGDAWELEPKTAFYDWLYLNALRKNEESALEVCQYVAFTDIEFNPKKSINCQAYSVALFVALSKRGMLEESLASKDDFFAVIQDSVIDNAHESERLQPRLF